MTRNGTDMAVAHYALRDDETGVRLAQWHAMDGFFVGDWTTEELFEDPDAVQSPRLEIALEDLEVLANLAGYRDEGDGSYAVADAVVEMLDPSGVVLGGYGLAWAALVTQPRHTGTLRGDAQLPPHRAAHAVWQQWRTELPREKGLWSRLPPADREGWLEAARVRYFHEAQRQGRRVWPMPEGEVVLNGHHVTDLASFFCAVGEAFNGPGGYFGANFMSLDDCLRWLDRPGGWRLSMVWEDIATAERALVRASDDAKAGSYFDLAVDTLGECGVDVIRA